MFNNLLQIPRDFFLNTPSVNPWSAGAWSWCIMRIFQQFNVLLCIELGDYISSLVGLVRPQQLLVQFRPPPWFYLLSIIVCFRNQVYFCVCACMWTERNGKPKCVDPWQCSVLFEPPDWWPLVSPSPSILPMRSGCTSLGKKYFVGKISLLKILGSQGVLLNRISGCWFYWRQKNGKPFWGGQWHTGNIWLSILVFVVQKISKSWTSNVL